MATENDKPDHVEERTLDSDAREAEIGRILNDFLDRRSRGEPASEVELYERYPQYADALREHLTLLGVADGGPGGESGGLIGDSIPGYQIVREIHRGGQGVVYQAIQKGTKRRVAIKVMREGPFAGHKDKARFEREVEVLGQLNHANIVAVHDSGVASGNFYFVMDYISGQPLEVWMAGGERSIEETLKLFAKICAAVNAAHLKGVVHRDLKPGNIRIDNQGEPRVLDFGLAKMATAEVTNGSRPQVMTVTGQFVGSLPWASPEQAEGAPNKIDMRTDVYALGVILYQMLTGKFPYEVIGNMRDVLDRILKSEPARPSTIRRQINDEVETIVLKCLSKERERRYQTAGELARDVGHYLSGEPIEAKRASIGYVLRKRLRRLRTHLCIGGAFTVLLVAVMALWLKLALIPSHTLTISTAGQGKTSPEAGTYRFKVGSTVQVSATPDAGPSGWSFDHWELNNDGMLSDWKPTTRMREGRTNCSVHFHDGRIYVVGGLSASSREGVLRTVCSAPIDADGSLGEWRSEANLPDPLCEHCGVVMKDAIVLFGGTSTCGSSATWQPYVYRSQVGLDGRLAPWQKIGDLPGQLCSGLGAVYVPRAGRTFLLGGVSSRDKSGPIDEVWAWDDDGAVTSMPEASPPPGMYDPVEHDGFVYIVAASGEVYCAKIKPNGMLDSWNETTALPEPAGACGVTIFNGQIYAVLPAEGHVYQASLLPNGVGKWQPVIAPMPHRGGRLMARAYRGYLYVFGGFFNGPGARKGGDFYPDVFYASIRSAGSANPLMFTIAENTALMAVFRFDDPECSRADYRQDFSSDPGWATNDPDAFHWTRDQGTFRGSHASAKAGWATTRVAWDGQSSFTLDWDMKIGRMDYAMSVRFGLFSAERAITFPHIFGDFHYADYGDESRLGIQLLAYNGRVPYRAATSCEWSTNVWYHCEIHYDEGTRECTMTVKTRDDSMLCPPLNFKLPSHVFRRNVVHLGVVRREMEVKQVGTADFELDNITFQSGAMDE